MHQAAENYCYAVHGIKVIDLDLQQQTAELPAAKLKLHCSLGHQGVHHSNTCLIFKAVSTHCLVPLELSRLVIYAYKLCSRAAVANSKPQQT